MYTMYLVVEAGRVPTLAVRVEGVLHPDLLPIVRGRCPWHGQQQNVQHVHKRVPHSGRYSRDIMTTKLTKISQKSLFNEYLYIKLFLDFLEKKNDQSIYINFWSFRQEEMSLIGMRIL